MANGQNLKTFTGHKGVSSIAFSPDDKILAISDGLSKIIKLIEVGTGRELKILNDISEVSSVAFSPDGKILASSGKYDQTLKLWDIETGKILKTLKNFGLGNSIFAFSPNGKMLAALDNIGRTIKLWDIETGLEIKTPQGIISTDSSIAFSPDGKFLASSGSWKINIWDVGSGELIKSIEVNNDRNMSVFLSVFSIDFSPNGKTLAVGLSSKKVQLWDIETGRVIKELIGQVNYINDAVFSGDGKKFASSSSETIKIWNTERGELLKVIGEGAEKVSFSPDGKILAGVYRGGISFWNAETGEKIKTFIGTYRKIGLSIGFSDDGKFVASNGIFIDENSSLLLETWDIQTGQKTESENLSDWDKFKKVNNVAYLNGRAIKVLRDGVQIEFVDASNEQKLGTLVYLHKNNWVITTPDGLYDTSPDARKLMHYVIGLETIALEQMKDLYYVPGLLQKIFKGDPLPKVELFSKKDLFPDVEFSQPVAGQKDLTIKLTKRGGGIGQVQVLVNGKEFVKDARPIGFDVNVKQTVTLNVSLKDAPFIAGGENKIEVVARNASGSLTNRGTPRGTAVFNLGGNVQKETPNIYAIVGGISNYTGDNLKLNFAAKDAEDFAKAIEVGAVKLLGDKSKVHIRLLTSNGANSTAKFDVPDAKISTATKADFERAFADFKDATPNDVFIVYLAGHGVSLNLNQNPTQAGGDTYLYLTQEATTTDKSVLSIENSRKAMAISSEELKDLMKQNKALKQVLILDTCAAGALSNSLVAKRDLPSDQIRAIERLKDNTGFYVLMGSSADAVSYEASQYGQGLLTYSLLQGMKGAKLRENQFADVNLLFAYAQETVPNMAKNIGGIQRPLIIMPDTSASFDIGKFTSEEQQRINLSNPKPIILRPQLRNSALRFDNLKLSQMMSAELRQLSYAQSRDAQSPIVFVEADEMTDTILISGDYTIEGDTLKISVILVKNNAPIGKEIVVTGKLIEKETLIKQFVVEIMKAAQ